MVIRLKNAHVMDGEKCLIQDLEIPCMEPRSHCGGSVSVLELQNCFLLPGLVDVHVHLREPGFFIKKPYSRAPELPPGVGTAMCAPCRI